MLVLFAAVGLLAGCGGRQRLRRTRDVGGTRQPRTTGGARRRRAGDGRRTPARQARARPAARRTSAQDIAAAVPPASAPSAHYLLRTGDLSLLVGARHAALHRRPHQSHDHGHGRLRHVERARQRQPGQAARADAARRPARLVARTPRRRTSRDHARTNPYATLDGARARSSCSTPPSSGSPSSARCRASRPRARTSPPSTSTCRRACATTAPSSAAWSGFLAETDHRQPDARRAGPHRQGPADHRGAQRPAQVAERDHHLRHAVRLPAREGHAHAGRRRHVQQHVRRHLLELHRLCSAAAPASPASCSPRCCPSSSCSAASALVVWYVGAARAARRRQRGAADAAGLTAGAAGGRALAAARPRPCGRAHDVVREPRPRAGRVPDERRPHAGGDGESGTHPRVRRPRGPGLRGRPDARARARARCSCKVAAATVNPIDVAVREDRFPTPKQPPKTLGSDGAGVVEAVGAEVTDRQAGRRVFFSGLGIGSEGSYAEYALHRRGAGRAMPDGLSFVEAAAMGMAFPAAYYALVTRGALPRGRDGPRAGRRRRRRLRLRAARQGARRPRDRHRERRRPRPTSCASLGADDVIDYRRRTSPPACSSSPTARASTSCTSSSLSVNLPADVRLVAKGGRIVVHRPGAAARTRRCPSARRSAKDAHAAVHEPEQRRPRRRGRDRRRDRARWRPTGKVRPVIGADAAARRGAPRPRTARRRRTSARSCCCRSGATRRSVPLAVAADGFFALLAQLQPRQQRRPSRVSSVSSRCSSLSDSSSSCLSGAPKSTAAAMRNESGPSPAGSCGDSTSMSSEHRAEDLEHAARSSVGGLGLGVRSTRPRPLRYSASGSSGGRSSRRRNRRPPSTRMFMRPSSSSSMSSATRAAAAALAHARPRRRGRCRTRPPSRRSPMSSL